MRKLILAVVTAASALLGLPAAQAMAAPAAACATPQPSWSSSCSWTMKFSDGFGGTTLDTSKWSPGWFGTGNTGPVNSEEKAGYSPSAVTLSGGDAHLSLTHKSITTPKGTFPYTGAILSAAGKFDYAFGAIEFDAYLPPNGSHIANWPALWTDGNGTWPTTGENDTMEGLDGPACWHFHSPAGGPGDCASGNFSGWHRFGSDWENGHVNYYYDGVKVGSINSGITSAPMFPIIDYSTDGSNTVAPATMLVNWVRVWKPTAATTAAVPCGTTTTAPTYKHVVWIWMENHSYSQIRNSSSASYINSVANQCGLATNYHNITHFSLPNYLASVSGMDYTKLQPFLGDCDPGGGCSTSLPSIFSQLDGAGKSWKAYEETMPSNCDKSNSGNYAVRHNPAPYFSALSTCSTKDVPYTQFSKDLASGSLPSFSFVTPNVVNDMHDGTIADGNKWLSTNLAALLSSSNYQAGNTAVFLTWDEGFNGAEGEHCATNTSDPQNCQVMTIVISPSTPAGLKVNTLFNHWGLLKTAEQMLGLPQLREATSATSMVSPFNL